MNTKWWMTLTAGSLSLLGGCSSEPPSTDALENALRNLAKQPSFTPKTQGAMCYSVAMEYEATYICPRCHHKTKYKTVYTSQKTAKPEKDALQSAIKNSFQMSTAINRISCLTSYRRSVDDISVRLKPFNYSAALDEQSCCAHCTPQGEAKFYLLVKRPDGTIVRNELDSFDDLTMLNIFLKGERFWGINDEEDIQKDIPALRKFLGLSKHP